VEEVDLERYMGSWYEIASFPQRFQKGCTASTATYSLRDDGMVAVVNRCMKRGRESTARGRARVVDPRAPAKLEVSFFGPFWGDYWIVDLGDEYDYAVVGHPSRDYLWILSRTPSMDPGTYDGILERLRAQGFELDRLQKTRQPPGDQGETAGR
jgi:apolipoprotein D and lipocalin family protein